MKILTRAILALFFRLLGLCLGAFSLIFLVIEFLDKIAAVQQGQRRHGHHRLLFSQQAPGDHLAGPPLRRTAGHHSDPRYPRTEQRTDRHAEQRDQSPFHQPAPPGRGAPVERPDVRLQRADPAGYGPQYQGHRRVETEKERVRRRVPPAEHLVQGWFSGHAGADVRSRNDGPEGNYALGKER